MNRVGLPEELIGPVIFLASESASFVTGVNLPVDGGWTAW
jgi:meso-butanediol dehydrogenase/(S,S)-butanediol dehydrogenase/diacetyl reductase